MATGCSSRRIEAIRTVPRSDRLKTTSRAKAPVATDNASATLRRWQEIELNDFPFQPLGFFGRARLQPVIDTNGVTNAASFLVGRGLAPGSYITIRGQGLSEAIRVASTASLPVSLAGVSVSFDAPSVRLSLPGRPHPAATDRCRPGVPVAEDARIGRGESPLRFVLEANSFAGGERVGIVQR
jgi:hypothetical protein